MTGVNRIMAKGGRQERAGVFSLRFRPMFTLSLALGGSAFVRLRLMSPFRRFEVIPSRGAPSVVIASQNRLSPNRQR